MNVIIIPKPEFRFKLTEKQVASLIVMSELHYDYVCKSYSFKEQQYDCIPQGILIGWQNVTKNFPESTVSATWNQLDIVLKICENILVLSAEDRIEINKFTRSIYAALRKSQEVLAHLEWTV